MFVVTYEGYNDDGYTETKCVLRDNLEQLIWIYLKYKKTAKIFSLNQIDEYVINEKIIEYEENEKQESIKRRERSIDILKNELKNIRES